MQIKNRNTNEIINQKNNLSLRFLYNTKLGNKILKIIIKPWFTKLSGTIMNSKYHNYSSNKKIQHRKRRI